MGSAMRTPDGLDSPSRDQPARLHLPSPMSDWSIRRFPLCDRLSSTLPNHLAVRSFLRQPSPSRVAKSNSSSPIRIGSGLGPFAVDVVDGQHSLSLAWISSPIDKQALMAHCQSRSCHRSHQGMRASRNDGQPREHISALRGPLPGAIFITRRCAVPWPGHQPALGARAGGTGESWPRYL